MPCVFRGRAAFAKGLRCSIAPANCGRPRDPRHSFAQEADLLHMERTVLNSLGFRVNAPTAYTFWSIFRMSHATADETSSLALYLTVRRSTL